LVFNSHLSLPLATNTMKHANIVEITEKATCDVSIIKTDVLENKINVLPVIKGLNMEPLSNFPGNLTEQRRTRSLEMIQLSVD